jgi:hypothetical protein
MAITPRFVLSGAPSDPGLPWRLLQISCVAVIVMSVIAVAFGLFDFWARSAFYEMIASSALLQDFYFLFGPIAFLVFLVAFAALLWITHRLARNLHALAPGAFTMSPTLAMAWYIVPIANIFMPPQVVDRIARTTSTAAGVSHEDRSPGWWWAISFLAALLSNVAALLFTNAGPGSDYYTSAMWTDAVASALQIIASVLTLRVFAPIARLQSGLVSGWRERNARP